MAPTDACTPFGSVTGGRCAGRIRNSKSHAIRSAFVLGMMVATIVLLTLQHCGLHDASFTKFLASPFRHHSGSIQAFMRGAVTSDRAQVRKQQSRWWRPRWGTRTRTQVVMTALNFPLRVAVTGAGGKTGALAFRKMLAQPSNFDPIGIVRTEESRASLVEGGVPANKVVVADITDVSAVSRALQDIDALVIATSAKPAPTGETDEASGRPKFGFPNGQPEQVDWLGQKAQIDAVKASGLGIHVVVCSSMGGTDPSNMLNSIGKETQPDGSTTGGNILLWKRKAEKYLIDSGLPYTIVHPGGLIDEPGGKREIVIGVDDDRSVEGERSIPREDVAEVLVQAVMNPMYRGRSFDIRSRKEGEGSVTEDFNELLDRLDGKNTDYSLGEIA